MKSQPKPADGCGLRRGAATHVHIHTREPDRLESFSLLNVKRTSKISTCKCTLSLVPSAGGQQMSCRAGGCLQRGSQPAPDLWALDLGAPANDLPYNQASPCAWSL